MKRSKLWNVIFSAILVLQLAAEGLTLAIIWRLDMLPDLYNIILVIFFALLVVLTGTLMFLHRRAKKVGTARRVIACLLAFAIVCGCAAVSVVVSNVYQTMHGITKPIVSTVTRSIYVRTDDPAQTLLDAADYTFAIVENYDTESTQQAIAVIESTLDKEIVITSYTTVLEMVDALYAKEADAIILNSAYVAILEEDESYTDFSVKTRVLHEVPVVGWTEPTDPAPSEPVESGVTDPTEVERTITNSAFVVYISGSDTRSSYLPSSTRSDVNILAVVNPVTKQVLLLNTPRDYYVPNPAGGGSRDKLTHCGIYGVDCSIKTLENLYGLKVDYNARINFTGFETLIDAVGGVTVYSDVGFYAGEQRDIWIQKGDNYLNGKQALAFARERYNLAGGDNARGKNQMKVIKAVIEKMTSGTTIISNYAQILDSMEGMFATDMEMNDISQLVKMQLSDMAGWNVVSYAVTGINGSEITYSWPGKYLSVMYVDEELVDYASGLVDRVIAGDILTQDDMKGPK